jgi:hypothetical protein
MSERHLQGTPLGATTRLTSSRSDDRRSRAPARQRSRIGPSGHALTLLLLLLLGACACAASQPSVLLFEANLGDARAFAVETASSRGWRVLSLTSSAAVFEQILEGDEEVGILVAERTLRVFADFVEESDGVRVSLRAEEVESPGTDDERLTDVTESYADNLANALASLRGKWDARRGGPAIDAEAHPSGIVGSLAPESSQASAPAVGDWAYAAERYAISRGCELTDRATQLESTGQGWEEHQVFCQDGSRMRVRCHHGDCTSSH